MFTQIPNSSLLDVNISLVTCCGSFAVTCCVAVSLQERQEDLKSAIHIASKIGPSEKSSKTIETLEKAKSDLSSHCGDLEDKLNYRLSLDLHYQKDIEMTTNLDQTVEGNKNDGKKCTSLFYCLVF